jgi:hypothetical protein
MAHLWRPILRAPYLQAILCAPFWSVELLAQGKRTSLMIDAAKMRATATQLREWARQIRRDAEIAPYATSAEDSRLLDEAALQLENAANQLSAK